MALQSDGKIVAVGVASQVTDSGVSNGSKMLIARFLGATPPALLASAVAPAPVHQSLTATQARPALAQALAYWRTRGEDTSRLNHLDLIIADLGDNRLGEASGSTITLDDDAAGWGWDVGTTAGRGRKAASGRMDLLSAVVHEVGHLLGHDHAEDGLMAEALAPGVRQADDDADIVAVPQSGHDHPLAALPRASSRLSLRALWGRGGRARAAARG